MYVFLTPSSLPSILGIQPILRQKQDRAWSTTPLPFVFLECITPYVTGTCCEYFTFLWTPRIQALVYTGWTVELIHSGLLRHGTNNFSVLYSLLEKLGHAYGCCHGSSRRGHMTVCLMALYTAPLGHVHVLCNMKEPRSMDTLTKNRLYRALNICFDHQMEMFCDRLIMF